MNVELKRFMGGDIIVNPARDLGMWVETVVTSPESSVGRKVYLWLSSRDCDDLLKELRSQAIALRRLRVVVED